MFSKTWRKALLALTLLAASVITQPASSTLVMDDMLFGGGACVTGAPSAEATTFLARTSGLDATHVCAYTDYINGLVTDGLWTKFDVLHVYSTQDTTTAQLNLVSASYPATLNGAPVFTADRGYQGIAASTTVYISTGFNPTTAVAPNFTQNSASLGAWINTSTAQASPVFGSLNGTVDTYVFGQYSGDMRFYFRVNSGSTLGIISSIQTADTSNGLTVANRSGANDMQGYRNGALLTFGNATGSVASPNLNLYAIGVNNNGTALGSGFQQALAFVASTLDATQQGNFYTRTRTFMTAVGNP